MNNSGSLGRCLRRCSIIVFFSISLSTIAYGASTSAGGALQVTVRAKSGHDLVPVSHVYVALVRADQPAYRPTIETIVDGSVKWEGIAAGRYFLLAQAPSFYSGHSNIEIADGKTNDIAIELHPQWDLAGSVVDDAGRPVKNALIRSPRIVPPMLLGTMSKLARESGTDQQTRSDDNGAWTLPVPIKGTALLVEAPGYEAEWVTWDPKDGPALPPTKLHSGSSLRVVTSRPDPELVLTLVPSAPIKTSIPADWHDRAWSREAATTALEWTSQPAGEYDLVASWPDPLRFKAPVTLRHVSLKESALQEILVALPETPQEAAKSVRVLIPFNTAVGGLHAFMRTGGGAKEVEAASEIVFGGRVLYAHADAAPEDIFFTTTEEVVLGRQHGVADPWQAQAPEGIRFPKADGTLKVAVTEPAHLPSHGNVRFHECEDDKSFVLPVNVQKSGDVALPLLVGCRALILRFEAFSPVVARSTSRPRDKVWLGTHHLKAAASVRIHVVHKSDGTSAADALVTAFVSRGPNDLLAAARQTTAPNGWLLMEGLPVGEEITFRAEDSTKVAGIVTRTLDPGKHEVIDPLSLPEAGSLTVVPHFEDSFKNSHGDIDIISVTADSVYGGKTDRRSVGLTRNQQEAVFDGLNAGSWHITATVRKGDLTQSVDVTSVDIESGDKKKIEPVIPLLLISGHLTSHGHGVAASISFTDPPGPGAMVRRVASQEDGSFTTMLPRPGVYTVSARRTLSGPEIELAPISLDHALDDARIELPESSLAIRVFSNGTPAADVRIRALKMSDTQQDQFLQLERRANTDFLGKVTLDDLQNGTWLVNAHGKDDSVAEKTVVVSASNAASVSLDLDGGTALEGIVLDSAGNPAGMAEVDCIYAGSDHIPRAAYVETDSVGKFSIHFPKPAADRLQCGVIALDGSIGAFVTAPVSDAQFVLTPATSVVTFTNWSDRASRDRFWLLAPNGGVFDLSWAAHKLRTLNSPFTIPRVPAGVWSVIRVDSAGAFGVVASGGASALPSMSKITLASGGHQVVSMQSGDTSGQR